MKKNTFRFALLSCLTLLLYTCKKEEPVTPPSQQFETGLPTDLPDIYYNINVAAFPPTGGLPESYILDMPPAGDQGQQGSCVAWAVAYGMKSYQRKIADNLSYFDGSSVNATTVCSPSYVYNQVKVSNDCSKGSYITDALNLLKAQGVCTLKDMGYNAGDCSLQPDNTQINLASSNKITSYSTVAFDPTAFKEAIYNGAPIVIAVLIKDNSFFNIPNSNTFVWSSTQNTGVVISHAMIVYGYDNAKNAFKVLNSWGNNWGNSGSFWLGYDVLSQIVKQAYVAEDGNSNSCPKVISLSGDLNFSNSQINPNPAPTKNLKILNSGTCPLTILNIVTPSPFTSSFTSSVEIQPNSSKDFIISFSPTSQGSFSGTISIVSNATNGNSTIQVSGSASSTTQTKIISLSGDLNFGNVEVNTSQSKSFSIFNNGNSPLNISSIDYPPNGFTGSTFSGNIQAGTSQNINVNFNPTSASNYNSTIVVNSNATSGSGSISCTGTGTSQQTRIINIVGDLNFGGVNLNTSSTKSITIYNNGNSPLNISSIDYPPNGFTGSTFSGNIQAGTSQNINVNFNPTSASNYNSTIVVNSNATSGSGSISCTGYGISSPVPSSVSPSIGTYTSCPTNNIQCFSLLEGNVIEFRVKSIDSQTGKITFEIKKCNGTNFLYPGYAYVNFSPCGAALNNGNYPAGFTTITMEYQPSVSEMSGNVTYYCTLATTSGNIGAYHAGSITLNY